MADSDSYFVALRALMASAGKDLTEGRTSEIKPARVIYATADPAKVSLTRPRLVVLAHDFKKEA